MKPVFCLLGILSLCPSLMMAQSGAATTAFFPLYVRVSIARNPSNPAFSVYDAYHSYFNVVNPNSSTATISFMILDPLGKEIKPLPVFVTTFQIAPFSFRRNIDFDFRDSIIAGCMLVTSNVPVIVQEEITHSSDTLFNPPSIIVSARLLLRPGSLGKRFFMDARFVPLGQQADPNIFESLGIGLALPLGSDGQADVILVLRDGSGNQVGQAAVSIPAGGNTLKTLTDLFPQVTLFFGGTLEIRANRDIGVTAVDVSTSSAGEHFQEANSGLISQ
ncbi:MAG TPA: hypothetical protein VGK99_01480 [Acidobacteriota bacterium]